MSSLARVGVRVVARARAVLLGLLLLWGAPAFAQICGGGEAFRQGAGVALLSPYIQITSPAYGSTFAAGSLITVNADADGAGSSITQVQFYAEKSGSARVLLGTDTLAPYVAKWLNAAAGSYILTATVTTNAGCSVTSSGVSITVSGSNSAPSVVLTAPSNGAAFAAPATISLSATASDSDGLITKVEFFNGATLIAADITAPYSFSWTNVAAGSYALTAKATDSGGATSTSPVSTVTVTAPSPSVSLTSPLQSSSFVHPASITLSATASISSGTISKVEFFDGAVLVGTDTTAPYSLVWATAGVGSHSLTARATSSYGTTATSTPPVTITVTNPAPAVSLTSPVSGSVFTAPASIALSANANDSNGSITKVQFFNGATLIATDTTAPYSFTWSNVAAASYALTAKATDNGGATSTSPVSTVTVTAPLPSVSLTSPLQGGSFAHPASITLSATAGISSGTISKVEFFDGAVLVGTDTVAPYSMVWTTAGVGSHALTARATSSFGTAASSSPVVTITVTNPPPAVSLTSPASGSVFTAPASIVLSANASDSNGSITKVEFFNGATLLATDTVAPYSFVWAGMAAGTYSITAKATDNAGAVSTSLGATVSVTAANVPPAVVVMAPTSGATFTAPATIDLIASASDSDGSVTQVEFYNGATLLATDTVAPYTFTWIGVTEGTYTITARAMDDVLSVTTSVPVAITVTAPIVPPSVALTSPIDGASFVAPATIALSATASDADGSVTTVEFYDGAILLGSDTAAPYEFTWSGVSPGTHTLTAKAYDNTDNSATSVAISITVDNPPPGVTITSPVAGASYSDPATIPFEASASTSSGSITLVEFLDGASVVASDSSSPYAVQWSGAAVGSHTLTARATTSLGVTVLSTPVSITVTNPAPSVTLTAPISGASFGAPANITLTANASDTNGTIAQVEFFNGATLLGVDAIAPYSFTWSAVPAGSHTLTAKATDNLGATAVSPAVTVSVTAANVPPVVAVTAPTSGATFVVPATIDIAANASDSDGSITQVEFYNGTALLATDTVAPYTHKWTGVAEGTYSITAKALDDAFAVTTSSVVTVTVGPPVVAPTVSLTAPADGASFVAPAVVTLSADANDSDGAISKVEFFDGATLLGTDTTAPYGFDWSNVLAGSYTLTAQASDNSGNTTTSAPVSITVTNCTPVVFLSAPLDGSMFNEPGPVEFAAGASSCAQSSITKVEFYQGATLLNADLAAPFEFSWSSVAPGAYDLTAKAYNTLGESATSPISHIIVNALPSVAMTTPIDGDSRQGPADFVLSADASDSDGSISKVEFYHGTTLLDTVTTAPYTYNWLAVGEGTYVLSAIAYDNRNAGKASAPVTVTVTPGSAANELPMVFMTSPANNSTQNAPANWTLSADASDADGSITRVEFYEGANLLGTATTAPYSVPWNNVPAGSYTLTATAYDDAAGSTTSIPILVTVTTDVPPPPVGPPAADPISDGVGATAGEFRVDESGAATYAIPLFAAPGTAGVTPQMSLVYSSQGGDGPLGRGWAISGLSSISRCRASREAGDFFAGGQAADGNPPPINFTASDRFCLDGQRLLAIAPTSATCPSVAGSVVTEYHTEIESYQRVCAYAESAGASPRFFTVDGKDGSTSWYGDRDTRTSAANAGNRDDAVLLTNLLNASGNIISWSQTRFQDSVGNTIDYVYLKDPAGAPFEGEQLISEVRYTGKVNLPGQSGPTLAPYAKIVFHYTAVPQAEYRLGYLSGSRIWQTQRLDNVESQSNDVTLRHYVLDYQTSVSGSGQEQLRQITECRDSTRSTCLAPTVFDWSTARNAFETSETVAGTDFDKLISFRMGDVDGDGRLDLVWFKNIDNIGECRSQLFVSFGELNALGQLTFNTVNQTPYCTAHLKEDVDGAWHLLDYNGDGKDDLFVSTAGANWALYPSQGRPVAGGEVFMASQNLLTSASPAITTFSDSADAVMLADLNGDGLLDVLYPKDTHRMVRLMERNAQGYGWGGERMVVVADETAAGPCFGLSDQCGIGGVSQLTGKVVLNDFDGDSRSDLLFSMSYREFLNKPGCNVPVSPPPEQYSVAVGGETMMAYAANTDLIFDPADDFSGTTVCRRTHTNMLAARVLAIDDAQVVLGLYQLWELKVTDDFVSTKIKNLKFADFNGDGLTDVVLKSGADIWTTHLNTGKGFNGKAETIGTLPNTGQLQLIDANGDGRADFVYPQEADNGSRPFHARFANADGTFTADALVAGGQDKACESNSCDPAGRIHLFADFDADGTLDFVRIKTDDPGHYASRAPVGSRYQPRDTLVSIINGLGATTTLTYLPLSSAEVYRSDANSRNTLDWGRGSPVQDVGGAAYVVAKAQSSSPTYIDDNATSAVHYRYQGAKAQAGGRGYLGFRSITTIESNFSRRKLITDMEDKRDHVYTTTEYGQAFPYSGLPLQTSKHVVRNVIGAYTPGACFANVTNACFQPAGTPFPAPGGILISDSRQMWEADNYAANAQNAVRVQTMGSDEQTFEVNSGTRVSHVSTMFAYDVYGNAELTAVDTFGVSDATALSTVRTANVYTNDITHWRLGRLTDSTVSHTRGADTIERHTRFTYDMSGDYSGLLTGEYLQEGYGTDQALMTLHDYDVFGNKVATYTCSDHFTEAACRSTAITFNPTDPLEIQRYSRTVFDSIGRYAVSTLQPFATGERATQVVISRSPFGDITQVEDTNGTRAISQYGQLGRAQYSWSQTVAGAIIGDPSDGLESWTRYRWCGNGIGQVDCPSGARFREQVLTEGGPTRWSYFDVLGRPILAAAQSFNAGQVGKDFAASCTYYDARGQIDRASEPFFLAEPASAGEPAFAGGNPCKPVGARYWTVNTTDVVDRVVSVTQPDGSSSGSAYSVGPNGGSSITFRDPLNHFRTEVRSALGELATSTDADGFSTQYAYDAIGNLVSVSRDAGNGAIVTSMQYDDLGRKIAQHDPDAGDWTYEYNALGEQIAQVDASENRTSILQWRDARGRVYLQTSGKDSDGGVEVQHQYTFDTASPGQLSSESSSGAYAVFQAEVGTDVDFQRSFSYDSLGRVIGSVTTIDGQAYTAVTGYDDLGRARRSQDPSGAWLKTEFDARGYAVRLCDSSAGDTGSSCASGSANTWRETLETDARGNVLIERRGGTDALLLTRSFEASTGRLLNQCAGGNCNLVDESYTWDNAGNLTARDKAGQYREVFSYDALNRVTGGRYERLGGMSFGVGAGPVSTATTYDKLGNLCSKTINGEVQDYSYGGPAGCGLGGTPGASGSFGSPHAVTQANGGSYYYDEHGNQITASYTDPTRNRSINYTAADQANQIRMGDEFAPSLRTRFWYGSDGSRYKREDDANGASTKRTLYVGNLEIVSQGGITTTKRYVAGVMVQDITGSTSTAQFLFHDHIGSVIRVVSVNGVVIEGMDYGAFGERRGYTDPTLPGAVPQTTPRGFTGHEMLDGTDIIHMNGRIYDSALGRFLQADPVIQEPNNPQNFNRYSYVLNNPLSLTDPSGYSFLGKVFKKLRPFIAIAIAIYAPQFLAFLGEFGAVVAGGFLSGVVSTGTLKGGLFGAFTAAAFYGVGSGFAKYGTKGNFLGSEFSRGALGAKVLSHGIVGGVMSELQGGKFGHGFVAAGVTEAFSGAIDGLDSGTTGISAERVFAAALVGGTSSALSGGKFANGAITGAFSRAFNDEQQHLKNEEEARLIFEADIGGVLNDALDLGVKISNDEGFVVGGKLKTISGTLEIQSDGSAMLSTDGQVIADLGVDGGARQFQLSRAFAKNAIPAQVKFTIDDGWNIHYRIIGFVGIKGVAAVGIGVTGGFNLREAIARRIPFVRKSIERNNYYCRIAKQSGLSACGN